MKSAEAWASELGIPDDIDSSSSELIQADATADLQSDMKSMSDLLLEIEMHCPCGARPETPNTHPHVSGCPVAAAITLINTPHKSGILIPQHPPKDLVADLQSQIEQLKEKCSAMQKALESFRDWDDESCPDKPELSDVCSSVYAALSLVEVSNGS